MEKKKSKSIPILHLDADDAPAVSEPAPKPAKKKQKIAITHFDDEPKPEPEKQPEEKTPIEDASVKEAPEPKEGSSGQSPEDGQDESVNEMAEEDTLHEGTETEDPSEEDGGTAEETPADYDDELDQIAVDMKTDGDVDGHEELPEPVSDNLADKDVEVATESGNSSEEFDSSPERNADDREDEAKEADEDSSDENPASGEPIEDTELAPTDKPLPPPQKQTTYFKPMTDIRPQPVRRKPPVLTPPVDAAVDKAIDDIIAKESDAVIAAEDAKLATAFSGKPLSFGQRIKDFIAAWWRNRWARYGTLLGTLVLLGILAAVPATRYTILNTVGMRVSTSMKVLDDKTGQPLKEVTVKVDNETHKTAADGTVSVSGLKLGPHNLEVTKPGFAPVERKLTLGWGSNPLGDIELTATGSRFTFKITDWLSAKPIAGTTEDEVFYKNNSAAFDEEGIAELTLEPTDAAEIEATVKVAGYREEKVTVDLTSKTPIDLKLVAAQPHVFISNRSGRYDVYRIDADGKNEKRILEATGSEREDMTLAQHPTKNVVALISTRENQRNKDKFLLSSLHIINANSSELKKVGQSERIQLVDWIGDKLVYVKIAEGASGTNPKRHRLMAYDINEGEDKELAASNYFNDVLIAEGKVFYAPSNAFQESNSAFLYSVNPDGTNKTTLLDKEVWNIFRIDEKNLNISVQQDWYTFELGKDTRARKIDKPAAVPRNRLYISNPDQADKMLWVDTRDGKGVLLVTDNDEKDKVLVTKSGLKTPVRWLGKKHVVFRVSSGEETADYIVSIDGGEPQKIKDVANTSGVDTWYYY